jgi:hypothetical protein
LTLNFTQKPDPEFELAYKIFDPECPLPLKNLKRKFQNERAKNLN